MYINEALQKFAKIRLPEWPIGHFIVPHYSNRLIVDEEGNHYILSELEILNPNWMVCDEKKFKEINIKFVFDDWRSKGKSIYNTDKGIKLSNGSFHSGTVFEGKISIPIDEVDEFIKNVKLDYTPVFYIFKVE